MKGMMELINNLMVGDLKISGAVKAGNEKIYCVENFENSPMCTLESGAAAAATGVHNMFMGNGNVFILNQIVGQTLISPLVVATGLDISGDAVADDGREINFGGGITARAPRAFTIGGPAFFAELTFSIDDVSGTDFCEFGFRKSADHAADATTYTDKAALNVVSGDILIKSNLNNAGVVSTDTTQNWADTASHRLRVDVSAAGVVTYKIDGAAPTITAALTLDTGDTVVPYISFLQNTDIATIILQKFECGMV
jgi:hypothetical protein